MEMRFYSQSSQMVPGQPGRNITGSIVFEMWNSMKLEQFVEQHHYGDDIICSL